MANSTSAMQPLVSILIPAYNAQTYLADTLRSALAQTWPNKEIIVVDDGSTDGTFALAQQFAAQGVIAVTHKNQGAAATRNKAFSLSKGEFIQWLDADDLLSPTKISRQMEALARCPSKHTLLSSGWSYFISQPSKANFVPTALWHDLSRSEWLIRKLSLNLHMQTGTWLTSRELMEKAGPWNPQMLSDDDGEYFCRVLMASEGVVFVPGPGVYYRVAGTGNLSYIGRSNKKIEAMFTSMKIHIECLRSLDDSPRARAACVQYLQNWSLQFYPDRIDLFTQMQTLATSLGGQLNVPKLSWKYSWICKLFGWDAAKRIQVAAPALKWKWVRAADNFLARKAGPIDVKQLA